MKQEILIMILSSTISVVISSIISVIGIIINLNLVSKVKKFRELKESAVYCLIMNACYYCNPADLAKINSETRNIYSNAADELRKVGSEFIAFSSVSPRFSFRLIPKRTIIADIGREFIGLSNSTFTAYNCDNAVEKGEKNELKRYRIEKLLKIKTKAD